MKLGSRAAARTGVSRTAGLQGRLTDPFDADSSPKTAVWGAAAPMNYMRDYLRNSMEKHHVVTRSYYSTAGFNPALNALHGVLARDPSRMDKRGAF